MSARESRVEGAGGVHTHFMRSRRPSHPYNAGAGGTGGGRVPRYRGSSFRLKWFLTGGAP